VPRVRHGFLRDWPSPHRRRRQDRGLTMAASASSSRRTSMNRSQKSKGNPMSQLNEKVALITGGSRGIGAAIAKRLAGDGANVAITYTQGADAAASVVKEIERAGGRAIAIQADAADADASKAAVEKT